MGDSTKKFMKYKLTLLYITVVVSLILGIQIGQLLAS